MGNYITQADLESKISKSLLIQLTDDDKTGLIDSAKIDSAIADAEAEINGHIATKYTVPVSPVTDLLKKLARTIAVKNLYDRRPSTPENVNDNYDNAVAFLKEVARGNATLGVDPAPAESSKAGSGETFGPERVFDRDKLGSF